jgi:hypothetical protein
MRPYRELIIDGYNNLVKVIRSSVKPNMDVRTSLAMITNSTRSDIKFVEVYRDRGIGSLLEIIDNEYAPRARTVLYDAIAGYLETLKDVPNNEAICLNVITCGVDSASVKENCRSLQPVITEMQTLGNLTITALCHDDAMDSGYMLEPLGIPSGNIAKVFLDREESYSMLADATKCYFSKRSDGVLSVNNFYEEE